MSSENTDLVNSPGSALVSLTGTPSPDPAELSISIRRRPIPRKGHTKSRRGCFNCKRRKVKCQESRPECSNCTRIGLDCEYPDSRPRQWQSPLAAVVSSSLSEIPSPSTPLQATAVIFTPDDMRFFHHFLVTAYPPLPIQGDEMWKNVAPLAHSVSSLYCIFAYTIHRISVLTKAWQYDYLMHAMLGLAASHLDIYGANVASHALSHRVKAINLLNQALSTPPKSTPEADARFAAIFALAFQASCMPEGMTEFMTMIKGSHVIAQTFLLKYEDSIFRSFTQVGYGESVRRILGTAPLALESKEDNILSSALESVRALAPLCTSSLEVKFLASTERVINIARVSATQGQ